MPLGLDQPTHILLVLVILLLLFGAKRLPEMGRGIGSGIRGFKDGITGKDEPAAAQPAPPAQPAAAVPALPAAPAAPAEPAPVVAASEQKTESEPLTAA